MILKALYDYAQSRSDLLPPPGMEWKEIEFVIVIDSEGRFKRFEHHRLDKSRCERFLVAKPVQRSSNTQANVLWDNSKYVLGLGDDKEECLELFIKIINDIFDNHKNDQAIRAMVLFYKSYDLNNHDQFQTDVLYQDLLKSSNANISFRIANDDELMAEKVYLYDHILKQRIDTLTMGCCLLTGKTARLVRISTPTPFSGTSRSASLVACNENKGFDSYGKSQGANSPISQEADEAYSSILKIFLGKDSRNKFILGKRVFLFWGKNDSSVYQELNAAVLNFFEITDKNYKDQEEKTEKVIKLFKSIYSGSIKTTLEDTFYILGLAPNKGRIAVVLWMDATLKQFAEKMLEHYEYMALVDNRPITKRVPVTGAYSMISAITRGGQISDALPSLIDEIVKAIISGNSYPYHLYINSLQRIKAEPADNELIYQRVANIKAYLNKKFKNSTYYKPLQVMLDKTNTNPGYLCGRLTAILEKIQADADSGDSIRTRYMGAASSTPGAVLPAMLNLSLHHSEKLSEGSRIFYEQLKQEIVDKISSTGFPAHLDLNDQGRFFVGYYHQRADLYSKKDNK